MFKLRLVPVVAIAVFSLVTGFSHTCVNANPQDAAKPHAEVAKEPDVAAGAKSDEKHEDHGHAKHEIDPTHSNMSDVGEDPAEWRSEKAIATLIVFGLLLLGLTAVAWKPIAAGLEKRERSIATNIKNAEQAAKDAAAKLVQYEAKLATATQEAQQIMADARKDAEAAGQRLIASAQEEAARQRDRAVADIESAKRVALNELAQQSTEVAMTLAQRIVGREVKAADHNTMIQDMLKQLPSKN